MRFVIQRVSSASVTIDGKVRGEIGKGFVVLIGIGETHRYRLDHIRGKRRIMFYR